MSYPLDIDEYTSAQLRGELRNRRKLRREGKCDYCGRDPSLPPCKFPERHQEPKIREPLLFRFMRFLRDTNQKPGVLTMAEMETVINEFRGRAKK